MRRLLVSVALGTLLWAAPATAQNIVTNPGFAGNLNNWTADPATTFDLGRDDTGTPGSGSARHVFNNASPGNATQTALIQCIPINAGSTYSFGGKIFLPAQQPGGTGAQIILTWYTSADCSVGGLNAQIIGGQALNAWFPASFAGFLAPPAAIRARIRAEVFAPPMSVSEMAFDDFFLIEETIVPALSLPWLLALAAATVLAAGVLLRPRPRLAGV